MNKPPGCLGEQCSDVSSGWPCSWGPGGDSRLLDQCRLCGMVLQICSLAFNTSGIYPMWSSVRKLTQVTQTHSILGHLTEHLFINLNGLCFLPVSRPFISAIQGIPCQVSSQKESSVIICLLSTRTYQEYLQALFPVNPHANPVKCYPILQVRKSVSSQAE